MVGKNNPIHVYFWFHINLPWKKGIFLNTTYVELLYYV